MYVVESLWRYGAERGRTWPNLSPQPYPQEQNSELQAKYQKLLVRSPGRWDRMGGLWTGDSML